MGSAGDATLVEVCEPGRVPLVLTIDRSLPIGRAGGGLLLGDERLSRHHCDLRPGPDAGLVIVDAGSSNGTFVNGVRIDVPTALEVGDVVTIGNTSIHVGGLRLTAPPEDRSDRALHATIAGRFEADPGLRASVVGGTITMVFSDIVDSTAHNGVLGDRAWLEVLRLHDGAIREQVTANGGTEIKGQGDGFFLTFPSARRGVLFASEAQRSLARLRSDHPEFELHVRIGVHVGEVIRERGDLFGRHVNLAARVAAQARGDEVVVSSLVHEIVAPMGDFAFGEPRMASLKGFDETTWVFPVTSPTDADGR